jgi:hypothetical protein
MEKTFMTRTPRLGRRLVAAPRNSNLEYLTAFTLR